MNRKRDSKVPRALKRLFPQLETVVNSRTAVKVNVSKADCATAKRLEHSDCAMARAARRQLKIDGAAIGLKASYLIKGTKAIRFMTPDTVAREVVSFDRHHDFAPGKYRLSPVSPSYNKPSRSGGPHPTKRSKAKIVKALTNHKTARVRVFKDKE